MVKETLKVMAIIITIAIVMTLIVCGANYLTGETTEHYLLEIYKMGYDPVIEYIDSHWEISLQTTDTQETTFVASSQLAAVKLVYEFLKNK